MSCRLLLAVALLAAAVPALAQEDAPAQGDKDAKDPSAVLFAKNCATCHAIPDTTLRTERAWLDQVNRTS
ncbi:MAG: hypothetical protein ACYTG4_06460 [Planctomycetota bacterium]|jgi:mono/diheme cytochrome c family protein